MHGSRSKIPSKKSRPCIYDVNYLALLGTAYYIYDISRLRVKGGVLTEGTPVQLPSLIGNVSYLHMKGNHCVIRGEIHAADDCSLHSTHRCLCVCVCVCVCGHLSALKWSAHCGRVARFRKWLIRSRCDKRSRMLQLANPIYALVR
jgi:hypothetical protein